MFVLIAEWSLGAIIYETHRYQPCPTIGMLSSSTSRQHTTPAQTLPLLAVLLVLNHVVSHVVGRRHWWFLWIMYMLFLFQGVMTFSWQLPRITGGSRFIRNWCSQWYSLELTNFEFREQINIGEIEMQCRKTLNYLGIEKYPCLDYARATCMGTAEDILNEPVRFDWLQLVSTLPFLGLNTQGDATNDPLESMV